MARTATKSSFTAKSSRNSPSQALSSERIAADLAAFRKAGGRIEVLGNTRALKHQEENKDGDN
ncbi:hypothetical protein [Stenotrophomonas sp. MMGLT7]|uniref:hypothetical protein n=1 Tax=Stenotrophomonas sp. MMGLT7 TaxID=2901227 RepID=UPI001E3245C5|nr:hypothetical protein [Stenotrophomonas sp. MMGLT7]MCD7097378.1 hypothetical protein [Stenotrophomonas sp. MMGLT7]